MRRAGCGCHAKRQCKSLLPIEARRADGRVVVEARRKTLIRMEQQYRRTELDGIVALTEEMPGVRSAAVGVWVRFGSVHERAEQMGVAHMLEHMVFKGTER